MSGVLSTSTWEAPLHLGSFFLIVWTISIPLSLSVSLLDTFFSLDLGWLNNSAFFALSQIPTTVRIPVSGRIWGGLVFGGQRWATTSLKLGWVGKVPSMILAMFKPSSILVSLRKAQTLHWAVSTEYTEAVFHSPAPARAVSPFHLPYSPQSSPP